MTAPDPRPGMAPDALEHGASRFPVVASQFARRDRAGLALGASFALLLGAATLFAMAGSRTKPAPAPAATPAPLVIPTPPPAPVATIAPAPPVAVAPAPLPLPNPNLALAATQASDRARSPALVFDNSPVPSPAAPSQAPAPAAAKPTPPNLTAEEQFAQRFGADGEGASAIRMTSPGTTVAQGTLIAAVLETAIDSDLPGFVRAVISRDVRSFDGRAVLIPRGSHLIGEYKSGLAVGQTRAYVLWTRLLRPDGVSVALGSPATDTAGRNGLDGQVSSHFGKRFGAAILLSVIGAAGQAVGGGTGTVILAGPQQAASATAQRDVSIPPTVRVALGQPIRVFVARDLDFAGVSSGK